MEKIFGNRLKTIKLCRQEEEYSQLSNETQTKLVNDLLSFK